MKHDEMRLNPTYKHSDDLWPMMLSATYDDSDVVRFYSPDGGTDIQNVRFGAKDELIRYMFNILLVYERNLTERGVTLNPIDWERRMRDAGVEVSE